MKRPNVLVIDDSPTIRKLVEIAARSTDWAVHFAENGRDGIATAQSLSPDVVLLDFMLPDMKGVDVCQRLAGDVRTSQLPVLVVTAKGEGVRELFRPFSSFAGWIAKPFTVDELIARVQKVLTESAESGRARQTGLSLSREKKELAAKALYAVLKAPLSMVPTWLRELGAAPAAPFLARKVLTPGVVEALVESLLPVYRDVVRSPSPRQSLSPPADDASFQGQLREWPLGDLLVLLCGSGRTGSLTLEAKERSTTLYVRSGEVVLATTRDPATYLAGAGVPLGALQPGAMAHAEAEQRASGKPVFVTLAEAGALPRACDLGRTLHQQSKQLLLAVLGERHLAFVWRDLAALPLYVEAYGRHVSPARETLMGIPSSPNSAEPASLAQLTLERLRQERPTHELPAGVAFDRVRGFSVKVRGLTLSPSERKVLALVDGHTPAEHIATRSGAPAAEVGAILHRLAEVGLVRARSESSVARAAARSRSVLILEPDVDGFLEPLRSMLSTREEPVSLVNIDADSDVLDAIRRERPWMVILNAGIGGDVLASTARAVRETTDISHVSLVAVFDRHVDAEEQELASAGFDTILVKPVAVAELERLFDA